MSSFELEGQTFAVGSGAMAPPTLPGTLASATTDWIIALVTIIAAVGAVVAD